MTSERHVTHQAELTAAADAAEAAQNWSEAIGSWTAYMHDYPASVAGPIGLTRALIGAKRFGAADALLVSAIAAFPNDNRLSTLAAAVAMGAGQYEEGLRRWRAVLEAAPNHPSAAARIAHCERKLHEESNFDPAKKWLLDQFTSLGRNCEVGLLQKSFGADRMGLLRYAQTPPGGLLIALQSRFRDIGNPGRTQISLVKNFEYNVFDTGSGIGFHTMEYKTDAAESAVLKKQCRRLRILCDMLIHELTRARQIFVYQNADLPDETACKIHDSLLAYGPNVLLCVREAKEGETGGSHRLLRPNLMLGLIDHEGARSEIVWDICTDQWEALLRTAFEQWRSPDINPSEHQAS